MGIGDPWGRIRARGRAYIDFALANPEHYRVIMMARHDAIPEGVLNEPPPGFEHLRDDVRAAIEAGEIHNQDPFVVASGLWMTVHGIASLLISKPDFPWPKRDELIDHVLHTHAEGLRRS